MVLEPKVTQRSEQPYVAIRSLVTMQELGAVLPPLTPEVYGWLAQRGVEPAGPCFWKYNLINMAEQLEVEVAVPVAVPAEGDELVVAGVLPAGRYAQALHVGHPDSLEQATADLLEWAQLEGLTWDVRDDNGSERWAARLEEYLDDPDEQPDLNKWRTNLIFKLAD